jgi:3-hydroxyisobutyrate dehydrogenase
LPFTPFFGDSLVIHHTTERVKIVIFFFNFSLGLDPKLLSSILGSATGRCWAVDTYNPVPGVMPNVPSSNEYKGGFGSSLMLKDLGLSQDAATRTNTSTPMGSLALHMYRIMCNNGYDGKDFSSAFQFLKSHKK